MLLWLNFSQAVASEIIALRIPEEDQIAFDNFGGGKCYAMSAFVEAQGLLQFNPNLPALNDEELSQALESASCSGVPVIIGGVSSIKDLSLNHQKILKKFLETSQDRLLKDFFHEFNTCAPLFFETSESQGLQCDAACNKKIAQTLIEELRRGRPITLQIDNNISDTKKEINHAVMVYGVFIEDDESMTFTIYDPNIPHKKYIKYQDGQFLWRGYPTTAALFDIDLNRYNKLYKYIHHLDNAKNELGVPFLSGMGTLKDQGMFLGKTSSHYIEYEGQKIFPIQSQKYNLNKLLGKNIVFQAKYIWEKDGLKKEGIKPVIHINEAYEVVKEKRLPQSEDEKGKYVTIGKIEDRGRFIGRKGGYKITENGQTKYILRSQEHSRLLSLMGEEIGVKGKIVDQENGVPVIEVEAIDDFKIETYVKIPPDHQ